MSKNDLDLQVHRLFRAPDQSYFLLGPRGTGKSTLVAQLYPKGLYIDLLLAPIRRNYFTRPELLLNTVRAQPSGQTIIIDEIQKVPELLDLVHLLIEERQGWQFVLTGSSARKLKQSGVDLLGGRALKKGLHPFMAAELGKHFDFEGALKYGLLPLRFATTNPLETLSSYVTLYLEEEVKMEGLVRHIEPFARFLEVLSFSHGSIVNLSNIARESAVKRSTAESWFSIVKDLLIAYQVPIFTRRAKRHLVSQPKFYFFDVGVYRALRLTSVFDPISEIDGAALEGLVAQHLRAWIDYTIASHKLYFWRTKTGLEVDFVIFGEMGLWAIEVKNSQHVHPKDLKGLNEFRCDYPEAKVLLLYRGQETLKMHDIQCMPCQEFLCTIKPNQSLFS
ncbi:MAG: ATPase [Gammaproteobacteria bacterium RIFCSPHIGHO2_02_FULL_42_13]|nr:MAG: ATPase [Gammaproteobacteria bacterium RIFCSPHIGHO2_02_FULL_42_13]OGT69739.1 MAG: ATPase [Gammaproteobacteria bacterium RIFCSPLOWO2_02_FULL_42_9]